MERYQTDHGHGGEIFALSEEERAQLIDFSVNINPLGLSPRGRAAVLSDFEREAGRYPDSECRELKQAVRAHYGVREESVTCGNGATELMYALVRALRPSAVYVPAPSFSEYRFAAEAASVPVHSFLLDRDRGFAPADLGFLSSLPMRPLLYLGNPNNPDGQILPKSLFAKFVSAVEARDGWLVIDESFIDFLDASASFRTEIDRHPQVVILLSLTKFYAVPGLRIGAAFSSPELARRLAGELCPWNVNGPAQRYISEALRDEPYIEASRAYVQEERRRMETALRDLPGLAVWEGSVNFFLLRLTDGRNGAALAQALRPHHLKIRECGNYEGLDETFVRIAVRRREENDRMLAALKEVLTR